MLHYVYYNVQHVCYWKEHGRHYCFDIQLGCQYIFCHKICQSYKGKRWPYVKSSGSDWKQRTCRKQYKWSLLFFSTRLFQQHEMHVSSLTVTCFMVSAGLCWADCIVLMCFCRRPRCWFQSWRIRFSLLLVSRRSCSIMSRTACSSSCRAICSSS